MQRLMDLNNDGLLSADEKVELEHLAEFGELLSLLRARAQFKLRGA